ncbi:hypothetical protein EY102_22175, partial [Shigella flexneri]
YSSQRLMHHNLLCQTVTPLQPRKPHLTSAQLALQRVNLQSLLIHPSPCDLPRRFSHCLRYGVHHIFQ